MDNVRAVALDVLVKIDKKEALSHQIIKDTLEKYQYSEKRDRSFFTRLCQGTLERQITIDYIIDQFSKTKVRKCKPVIRGILRMSVYQMMYMEHVPDSAICNEAVKLSKKRGFQRLSGFVNGVLRGIIRGRETISYPKKENSFIAYVSVKYSIPEWMVSFFLESYSKEEVETIAASYLEPKKTTISIMTSKISKEELIKKLQEQNVTVTPGNFMKEALFISDYDFLNKIDAFRNGTCMVQDESSMLAGHLADVKEDQVVLDVCSAPGGKALFIADKLNGTGKVIARDLTEYKEELIWENIDRMHMENMTAQVKDATELDEEMINQADIVIADVPCSGLGIIGKKGDIKYNITRESFASLVQLQREILSTVVQYVKPGGTLMFSTCTINPMENIDNVVWLQEQFDLKLVPLTDRMPENLHIETAKDGYIQLLPGIHPCDGFFIAKFRRSI
ncbi:MAG: 16S rRNA (cytosine(967)-C(5))-methyltransferase RsmB [Anaerostipes sp.]|nr:16S rRNA (cytosine(967)-C(5))-methyltransferase RsmB [Anaerostipes sp.]